MHLSIILVINQLEAQIYFFFFDVLLTMHLSIILVINQLEAQIYFFFFYILLTVHLSIILVINQLETQIYFFFFDILLTVHLSIILVSSQLNAQICESSWLITKIILRRTVSKTSKCGQLFHVKGKVYFVQSTKAHGGFVALFCLFLKPYLGEKVLQYPWNRN